jgi:hypothetical protein
LAPGACGDEGRDCHVKERKANNLITCEIEFHVKLETILNIASTYIIFLEENMN